VRFLRQKQNEVTMNGVDVSKTYIFQVSPNKGNVIRDFREKSVVVDNLVITTKEFLQTVQMEVYSHCTRLIPLLSISAPLAGKRIFCTHHVPAGLAVDLYTPP
jgi:hypothetical protein